MTYKLVIQDSVYDKIIHMKEYADEIGLTNNVLEQIIEEEEKIKDETNANLRPIRMRPAIDDDHNLG